MGTKYVSINRTMEKEDSACNQMDLHESRSTHPYQPGTILVGKITNQTCY